MSSTRQIIESKVRDALQPAHLEVIDESHMHSVPAGSESHFRLVVVSDAFDGLSPVERHRQIYRVLADELRERVHALGLQTLTPAEWSGPDLKRTESPPCLGGSKAPSADSKAPSADSRAPSADSKAPSAHSRAPSGDGRAPS